LLLHAARSKEARFMKRRTWVATSLLAVFVIGGLASLAGWKHASLSAQASAAQPEPMESVTAALVAQRSNRPTTTAIGTIVALRSVTLRNELPGTVRHVNLEPGQVVAAGTVLVRLDVSVEDAELRAQQAQLALAAASFDRTERVSATRAASEQELDRARAERDMALATVERTRAIIARKTIRAPFRARVGISDVHVGQYLDQGTPLTTLQGVDAAAHVDFAVPQAVAELLRAGDAVQVHAGAGEPSEARIVAIDARVDRETRNATVRARIEGAGAGRAAACGRGRAGDGAAQGPGRRPRVRAGRRRQGQDARAAARGPERRDARRRGARPRGTRRR
jgi:membrane fusion protein, multidrug efflux system